MYDIGKVIDVIPENERISIEFKEGSGWNCMLEFDEYDTAKILSAFTNDPIKNPNILLDQKMTLVKHPYGGNLAPIGVVLNGVEIHKIQVKNHGLDFYRRDPYQQEE